MCICKYVCMHVEYVPVTIRELMTGLSASPKSEVKAKYRNALANPDVYAAYLRLSSLCACMDSIGCSVM